MSEFSILSPLLHDSLFLWKVWF